MGRRVCAVVGSGDNGGDALWAATFLRRRGAAADAVLLNPERTHRKALAAFTKAGGRVVERVATTTDLVIDGVVGLAGSGRCVRRPPRSLPRSMPPGSRWSPWISPAASTRTPARSPAQPCMPR
ncbi:yjeF-related family protein [Mycobacterium xenopi 3993]|nr:yjeF-related family protein [Mycobacterium xenopi 3993]